MPRITLDPIRLSGPTSDPTHWNVYADGERIGSINDRDVAGHWTALVNGRGRTFHTTRAAAVTDVVLTAGISLTSEDRANELARERNDAQFGRRRSA